MQKQIKVKVWQKAEQGGNYAKTINNIKRG